MVNLGRDDESDPEEDSHAENIDYDYDPESPVRNLPQSETPLRLGTVHGEKRRASIRIAKKEGSRRSTDARS